MIFNFVIEIINYSSYIGVAIVSIAGAFYMPILGLSALLALSAIFFDYNKKIYGHYFISPKIFFDKKRKLRPYHKLLFYLFSASLTVNLMALLGRLMDGIPV